MNPEFVIFHQVAEEAGVPPGVINIVTCSKANTSAVGKVMCESPLVAKLSFTGSTNTGKVRTFLFHTSDLFYVKYLTCRQVMCESPLVAKLSFTGSTNMGKLSLIYFPHSDLL